jgi:hypothetical protein
VGFVLVSLIFLGGIGGPVLYLVACVIVPEEGREPLASLRAFSGRPWHDWDRSARSWALVLACATLALMWSFGLWPSWHWQVVPVWVVITGVALLALARRRSHYSWPHQGWSRQGWPHQGWPHHGRSHYGRGPAAWPGPSTVPSGGPAGPGSGPDASDWAEANATAASWAASQLAAAGVSPVPPVGVAAPRPSWLRRLVTLTVAALFALLLCTVAAVAAFTLGSGSSLRGGLGDSTYSPASSPTVAAHYRLGAGSLNVDLSSAQFPARDQTVDFSLGLGQLSIVVPADATVNVDAHCGLGQVDLFSRNVGSSVQGTYPPTKGAAGAHELTLVAHVGMGSIQVTRG